MTTVSFGNNHPAPQFAAKAHNAHKEHAAKFGNGGAPAMAPGPTPAMAPATPPHPGFSGKHLNKLA